jgi:hypothetical protein
MLAAASIIPDGIHHNPNLLCVFPDPAGPQHDECKAGSWQPQIRSLPTKNAVGIATVHRSVYRRFEAGEVVQYDERRPYRPVNLSDHVDFEHYFKVGLTAPQRDELQAVADNIENKWTNRSAPEGQTKIEASTRASAPEQTSRGADK